jgi:hypothetical protein
MKFNLSLTSVFTLLAFTSPASAANLTYYVSTSGSDSYTCTQAQSASTPKATISAGVGCLSSGDTLSIRGGSYTINYIWNIPSGNGSWATATTISNYPGETVTITYNGSGDRAALGIFGKSYVIVQGDDRSSLVFDGQNERMNMVAIAGSSHIRLKNLTIKNVGAVGSSQNAVSQGLLTFTNSSYPNATDDLEIQNVLFDTIGQNHFEHAAYVASVTNSLIEGCEFTNLGGYGICEYGSSTVTSNNTYRNNIFHDFRDQSNGTSAILVCSGDSATGDLVYNNLIYSLPADARAIEVGCGQDNTVVYNNTIYNTTSNSWGAIVVDSGTGTLIRNNIIHTSNIGIKINGGSGAYVQNNDTYKCSTAISNSGSLTTISDNLTRDPLLVNPARDLHLQSQSPMIEAGLNNYPAMTTDYDGNARPTSGAWDIGAYQWVSSTSRPSAPNNLRISVR